MQAVGLSMAPGAYLTGVLLAQRSEFAFVVFPALPVHRSSQLKPRRRCLGAVAMSVLLSPLLLVGVDKLFVPLYARSHDGQNGHPLADISEPQTAPVTIAGFGHYGQIVGRILLTRGIAPTVLDHDATSSSRCGLLATVCLTATPRGWTSCALLHPAQQRFWW